jgi:hypothetical protein
VGAHGDQVGAFRRRLLDDRRGDAPAAGLDQLGRGFDAGLARPRQGFGEKPLALESQGGRKVDDAFGDHVPDSLIDVRQADPGALVLCELQRLLQSRGGGLAAVQRDENALVHGWALSLRTRR